MKTTLLTIALGTCLCGLFGCEEEKPKERAQAAKPAEEPEAAPAPKSPPHLIVGESGPSVRGSSVILTQPSGAPDAVGRGKLKQYLSEEKEFIEGKELRVVVDRKAKPSWVAIFLADLGELSPAKVTIATDTRDEYPKEITFVPASELSKVDSCTLVGTITDDRGTAIWRVSGGTARKRGRGMGGPDLTMTQDTISDMKKKCDSDVFVVTGPDEIEWGLLYDLAAAGISLEGGGLSKAAIPVEVGTAGHALVVK